MDRLTLCIAFLVISISAILPTLAAPTEYITDDGTSRHHVEPNHWDFQCPEGYEPLNGMCFSTTITPSSLKCSQGNLDGESCIHQYEAMASCPPDYHLVSKKHKAKKDDANDDTCVKLTHLPPAPVCEEPYVLDTINHVCKYIHAFEPKCPKHFDEVGDHCVHYKHSSRHCPDGFHGSHQDDEMPCQQKVYSDALEVCEHGDVADGICASTVVSEPTCPAGSIDEGNDCKVVGELSFICPDGFIDDSKHSKHDNTLPCVSIQTAEPHPVCRDGLNLVEGKCTKSVLMNPTCPAGTEDVGDRCASYLPANPQCTPEYTLKYFGREPVCVRTTIVEATPSCSHGYFPAGESCVKIEHESPSCDHHEEDVGDACATYTLPKSKCPEGFTESSHGKKSSCVSVATVKAEAKCEDGYELVDEEKGVCEKMVCELPMEICESGFRQDDGCVEFAKVQMEYYCPDGFELSGDKTCKTLRSYDCYTVDYEIHCEDVVECDETTSVCPAIQRRLVQKRETFEFPRRLKGMLGGDKSEKKRGVCQKVAVERQSVCEDTMRADAVPHCPEGSSFNERGECQAVIHSQPVESCTSHGMEMDEELGVCIDKKYGKPHFSCPDDFRLHKDKVCRSIQAVDGIPFCSEGELTSDGRCVTYTQKKCKKAACESRKEKSMDFECPVGLKHKSHGTTPTCEIAESAEVLFECLEGELYDGNQCVSYSNKNCFFSDNCEIVTSVDPVMECPGGYAVEGHKKHGKAESIRTTGFKHNLDANPSCYLENRVNYIPYCQDASMVQDGDSCVRREMKRCPNDMCERRIETKPKKTCPEGRLVKRDTKSHKKHLDEELLNVGHKTGEVCEVTQLAEMAVHCKEGEIEESGRCAVYANKTCETGDCRGIHQKIPKYECPGKLDFVKNGKGQKVCLTSESVEPRYICQKGEDDGQFGCRKVTSAERVCPVGWTLTADLECIVTKFTAPSRHKKHKKSNAHGEKHDKDVKHEKHEKHEKHKLKDDANPNGDEAEGSVDGRTRGESTNVMGRMTDRLAAIGRNGLLRRTVEPYELTVV